MVELDPSASIYTREEITAWAYDVSAMWPFEDFDVCLPGQCSVSLLLELAMDLACPKRNFFLSCLYIYVGDAVRHGFSWYGTQSWSFSPKCLPIVHRTFGNGMIAHTCSFAVPPRRSTTICGVTAATPTQNAMAAPSAAQAQPTLAFGLFVLLLVGAHELRARVVWVSAPRERALRSVQRLVGRHSPPTQS